MPSLPGWARDASYPLRPHNRLRPLVDGEAAFRRIGEAARNAQRSVWVTVAFLEDGFRLPDPFGGFFELLDELSARGLDVRVLFWRSPAFERLQPGAHFPGTPAQRRRLAERGSRFLARWDQLPKLYCHHQKSWLIDAGEPGEVAFVGGINLDTASVVPAGHPPRDGGSVHDVYLELGGPAATDVHHNFVQRWNGASDRMAADGCWPEHTRVDDLPFPRRLSAPAGTVDAQISRTIRREVYGDGTPTPGGEPFPIARGEASVLQQYLSAIDAARSSIYIEDQVIASLPVIEALRGALARGVEVVYLVPGAPNRLFVADRRNDRHAPLVGALASLAEFERFTLAAVAANAPGGGYADVYVHAKIALVDDAWATIGSTNVANRSFHADSELNVAFWDVDATRELRRELFREHLGIDTGALDDRAALRRYREIAVANAERRARGDPLESLALALDPRRYGENDSPASTPTP